jgi:hypothetical protein
MRVGIIRTVGGLPVCTNASAIEPWFDVAAFPYSPASAFGIALDAVVLAFRVLRPIQRKAAAHKPFAKIVAADRTGRNGTAIRVEAERRAVDRTPGNECVKVVCCLSTTAILQTVLAAAQLGTFGRVNAPEPDADAMNFQSVAVDDAGLTNEFIGHCPARQQQEQQERR